MMKEDLQEDSFIFKDEENSPIGRHEAELRSAPKEAIPGKRPAERNDGREKQDPLNEIHSLNFKNLISEDSKKQVPAKQNSEKQVEAFEAKETKPRPNDKLIS